RDDRTLRGVRHGTEDVVPAPRLNRVAGVVALPGLERAPLVAHRNAGRGAATFGHENQANAERPETLRLRHDVGKRVVSLAVGEHDHDPIGELGPRADQLRALPQRPRQSGTARGRDPGGERGPYRLLGPQGGATDPSAPGPRGPEPDRAAQQRRQREYHGRVEAHQGTRTASVAANTISSPSATRPSASGTRYDSSNRRY